MFRDGFTGLEGLPARVYRAESLHRFMCISFPLNALLIGRANTGFVVPGSV